MIAKIIRNIRDCFLIKDCTSYETLKAVVKGSIRTTDTKLIVGDFVHYEKLDDQYVIVGVQDRNNMLIRPNVSNVDIVFIVQSIKEPDFNIKLLCKLIAFYEINHCQIVLIITKSDIFKLTDQKNIQLDYLKKIGYLVYDANNELDILEIKKLIFKNTICFIGNSGVGKSTLINKLDKNFNIKTQVISKSLNRGKHTTTSSTIYDFGGGEIIDTPGFSTVNLNFLDIKPIDLATVFFRNDLITSCKFRTCLHDREIGCSIKSKVDITIPNWRYIIYIDLLNEIRDYNAKAKNKKY